MKTSSVLLSFTLVLSSAAFAEPMCEVKICNKLERFTIHPTSMIKDHFGKSCYETSMPKSEAIVGKKLSSNSRWYQGSFNPTKKSVTRIKSVGKCG
ncbi:MAG: hypothetical protein H7249_02520 [Chitinophagaceae bacterium]|nr:hypothetical protein [Oligoflexus sp.]